MELPSDTGLSLLTVQVACVPNPNTDKSLAPPTYYWDLSRPLNSCFPLLNTTIFLQVQITCFLFPLSEHWNCGMDEGKGKHQFLKIKVTRHLKWQNKTFFPIMTPVSSWNFFFSERLQAVSSWWMQGLKNHFNHISNNPRTYLPSSFFISQDNTRFLLQNTAKKWHFTSTCTAVQ